MIRILLLALTFISYNSFSSDLLVKRIDAPLKQVSTSDPITFIYTVENITPITSSDFQTTIQLFDSDMNKIFEDIVNDSKISGFDSRTTGSSKTWNPLNGNFLLIVSIENNGDQNIENNKIEYEFTVSLPVDCPKSAPIQKAPINGDNTLASKSAIFLRWENPGDEDSVCVYISRIKEEVENEDPNAFLISGVDLTSFVQFGIEKSSPEIYWKVVAKCGNNKKSSPVWSFSTRSCEVENATNLKPDYGAEIPYNNFRLNKITALTWDLPEDPAGEYIINVYLSSDSAAVQNLFPGTLIAQGNNIDFVRIDGMDLLPDTDYYWLVMITCPVSYETFAAYTSSKFKIGGLSCYAKDPIPGSGNTQISTVLKQLRWTLVGDEINNIYVYLSLSKLKVENEDSDALIGTFQGERVEQISIPELDRGFKYNWKVICDNGSEAPIWEFNTTNCSVPHNLKLKDMFKKYLLSSSLARAADVQHHAKLSWTYNGYEQMKLYLSRNKESVINQSQQALVYQKEGSPSNNHSFLYKSFTEGKYYWTVTTDCVSNEDDFQLDSFRIVSYLDTINTYLKEEDFKIEKIEASGPDHGLIIKPSDFEGLEWNIKIKFGSIIKNKNLSEYNLEDTHVFLSHDSTFSGDITKYWVGKTSNSLLRAADFEKQELLPLKNDTTYYWFFASFDKKTNSIKYISPIWSFRTQPVLSINEIKNDFDFFTSPNPVENQLNLSFNLEIESDMILEIYDLNMRKYKEINLGRKSRGQHEETVSSSYLSNGFYYLVLNQQALNGKYYRSVQKVIKK